MSNSPTTQDAPATGLPAEGDKSVSVIFNPVSGKSDPEQRKKEISDALAEHGYTCQYLETTKDENGDGLAKKAIADGVKLLVVSGGDGTVMEVLSAVIGTDIPVAVLPAGTGNLLSVNLGIPTTVPEAVHVALSGRLYKLDLAKTGDGKYFAIMGGVGMDAQMIHDADREAKNKFGPFAYFWSALKNVGRKRVRVDVRLDGGAPLTRRVKSVIVANMGKITGGVEAMPTASPDDGLLDVGLLMTRTPLDWLRLAGNAFLGRTQDDPMLEVHQVRRVDVHTEQAQPCQLDGEDVDALQDWTVEVMPHAVQVLLPEDAPAAKDAKEPPAEVARQSGLRRLAVPVITAAVIAAGIIIKRRRR